MEKAPEKRKLRPNLFDIIFIACIVVVAVIVVRLSGSDGVTFTAPAGEQRTVTYTIIFERMIVNAALLVSYGDELIDRVENRPMGRIVSVDIQPARTFQPDLNTGNLYLREVPERNDVFVVVEAPAVFTESQISLVDGGFVIRAGVSVSISGPGYNAMGFIVDIERSGAA